MVVYIMFVPETNRKIVGNGSIPVTSWWNKSGWDVVQKVFRKPKQQGQMDYKASESTSKLRWPRPWKTIVVLFEKDVAITLFSFSIVYAAFYAVMATIPTLFAPIYGLNETQVGLCYM